MDTIREETPNITLERLKENFYVYSKTYTQTLSPTSGKGWLRTIYDRLRKRSDREQHGRDYREVSLYRTAYKNGIRDALNAVYSDLTKEGEKSFNLVVFFREGIDEDLG